MRSDRDKPGYCTLQKSPANDLSGLFVGLVRLTRRESAGVVQAFTYGRFAFCIPATFPSVVFVQFGVTS